MLLQIKLQLQLVSSADQQVKHILSIPFTGVSDHRGGMSEQYEMENSAIDTHPVAWIRLLMMESMPRAQGPSPAHNNQIRNR